MKRIISIILTMLVLLSLVACGKSAEPTWQEQYDLGVRYLSDGNYEEAVIAFTAAIEIDPKREEAYVGLADVYYATGDTAKAEEILAQIPTHEDDAGQGETSDTLSTESHDPNATTDEQLVAFANEHIEKQFSFLYGMNWGAAFSFAPGARIVIIGDTEYAPIEDERISSLADIQTVWEEYFARSYKIPDRALAHYYEQDGVLYTDCLGIGGDEEHRGFEITEVRSRDEVSAVLTGREIREHWEDGSPYYKNVIYNMTYEDGEWKCSGIEIS